MGANQWLEENNRLKFKTGEDYTKVIERDIQKSLRHNGFKDIRTVNWLEGRENYNGETKDRNDINRKNYYEYIIEDAAHISKDDNFLITLNPMQIRTFVINIKEAL